MARSCINCGEEGHLVCETYEVPDPDVKFVWPFPTLRYWFKTKIWCRHPQWSDWCMIDTGMRQIRWCERCGKAQIR